MRKMVCAGNKFGVCSPLDVQFPTANVVQILLVQCHIGIRVRQQGIRAQDSVVRLTDHGCDLRAIPHRFLPVADGHRYQKQALEPGTSTPVTARKTDMDAIR